MKKLKPSDFENGIDNIEFVYSDIVKDDGNSAKISCPKRFLEREAIVIIG